MQKYKYKYKYKIKTYNAPYVTRVIRSNFVFKTRRFYDIRLQNISWPWNGGQRSLKVIESGIIR